MPKPSHRTKLLAEGLRIVRERGFNGASVRDIVQAAGVPQGSFTNHFTTKEAFALEVVELYDVQSRARIESTLGNIGEPPLTRLKAYLEAELAALREQGVEHGSLVGNLAIEASGHSDMLRQRIQQILDEREMRIAQCIAEAMRDGTIRLPSDPTLATPTALARYVQATLHGSILLAKVTRSPQPILDARDMLMATLRL